MMASASPEGADARDSVGSDGEGPLGQDAASAFAALGLGEPALRAIADLGYGAPTPIQAQTIPALVTGRDVVAQAPTGTGKTAAFGLPLVERLDESELRPQALVITPTRELAIQVAEVLHALGRHREMVTIPIYGGQPYERQFRALKRGVQVVVGTPGRLLDHLQRGTLDLSSVRTVVLDEADEMLDMGFIEDIEAILAALPETRQGALFSATIPPRIARLAQQYLHDPVQVRVAEREAVAPQVRQVYYEVPGPAKADALSRILDLEEPESVIVFVRTRRDADILSEQLGAQGYVAQAIHGEVNQAQRERALERFRQGRTQVLVATDVAARGLDIPDVSHIINYDLPFDAESYVHRIGRTGRAGRTGEALTLVTPRERRQLFNIERAIHRRLERLRLPTPADIAARRRAAFRDEVMRVLDEGELDPYLALVEDLAGTRDPSEIAAAAFKLAAQAREVGRGTRRAGRPESTPPPPGAYAGPSVPLPLAGAEPAEHGAEHEPAAPARPPREAIRESRPERPSRAERPGRGRREPQPMARLLLKVGKRDWVRPADIVGAIANEAGLPGEEVGDIDLYDTFSFVEVPEEAAEATIEALNRTTIRNRRPQARIARPDWQQHEDDRDRRPARGRTGGRDEAPRRDRQEIPDREPPFWAARARRGILRTSKPALARTKRRPGPFKAR